MEKGFLKKAWNRSRSVEPVEASGEAVVSLPLAGIVAAGTPIAVASGATTDDIDFALTPGHVVSGRVTDAATGAGLASGSDQSRRATRHATIGRDMPSL